MLDEKRLETARPILFNTEMVRAILDGRKTVTRRVIKQYVPEDAKFGYTAFTPDGCISARGIYADGYGEKFYRLPYHPGDCLYVRETFAVVGEKDGHCEYGYKADNNWSVPAWKPSIHMPKEAARIFLRVTNIRVERLQEIEKDRLIKEGIDPFDGNFGELEYATAEFAALWDSTIKNKDRDKYGWDANPYVFVISFERIIPKEEG